MTEQRVGPSYFYEESSPGLEDFHLCETAYIERFFPKAKPGTISYYGISTLSEAYPTREALQLFYRSLQENIQCDWDHVPLVEVINGKKQVMFVSGKKYCRLTQASALDAATLTYTF